MSDRWISGWMFCSRRFCCCILSVWCGRVKPVVLWFQVGDSCLHVAARYNNQSVMKILLHSVDTLTNTNQVVRLTLATLSTYTA